MRHSLFIHARLRAASRQRLRVGLLLAWGCLGLLAVMAAPPLTKEKKTAATPASLRFSLPGGLYTNALSIALTGTVPGAAIHYSTNGREPTPKSPVYTSAIPVVVTTCLRARSFTNGQPASPIAATHYTLLGSDVADFTSNLPVLILSSHDRQISDDDKIPGRVTVIPGTNGHTTWRSPIQFQGRIGVELRGSSSMQFPKHSMGLALTDEQTGADHKAALLDLPAESDWVLYAPYTDKSFLRDVLGYDWWEAMGHYSVRHRFVELFLHRDGGRLSRQDYAGIYVLIEKIKQGAHRVNIAKLTARETNEPAISGGYILKKDRTDGNDHEFNTSLGHTLGIEYPKKNNLIPAHRQWIKEWFRQFESTLTGTNFAHPTEGYAKYIDVRSFIDHFWIIEMPKTIDGYVLSTFMHKDRNGKLALSPIWDRNLSLGNVDYLEGDRPTGWFWEQLGGGDLWFRRLFQDPDFYQRHVDRWWELRNGIFATPVLLSQVSTYTNLLKEAQARDFARWPRLGTHVWPNAAADWTNKTYAGTIRYMTNFLVTRLNWIDRQFVPNPVPSHPGGAVPLRYPLTLGSGTNTVWYTLNGTDPRQPGGGINPVAYTNDKPLPIKFPTRLIARTRQGNRWSAPVQLRYTPTEIKSPARR